MPDEALPPRVRCVLSRLDRLRLVAIPVVTTGTETNAHPTFVIMRRRRVVRREPTILLVVTAAAGTLLGITAGMLLAQKHGGVATALRRLRDRASAAAEILDNDDGPPESVYEIHGIDYDSDEDGEYDDEIEVDVGDAESASELENRVLQAFLNDPVLEHCAIEISAEGDGVVELHGWVENPEALRHAATIAGGVPGVVGLSNNLHIRRPRRIRTS